MIAPSRPIAILALAAAPTLLGAIAGEVSLAASTGGAGLVLLGLGVIRLARGRWLTAPHLMLVLCFAGMALGLLADRQSVMPATLLSLCLGKPSVLATIVDHWAVLPATTFGMILGGFATVLIVELRAASHPGVACRKAICARAGFNLTCNAAMLSGMLLGGRVAPRFIAAANLQWSLSAMMAAMAVGMVLGMAATMVAYRAAIALTAGEARLAASR